MHLFPDKQKKQLWIFSISFGLLGALLGLFLRYAYTGNLGAVPLKNILHSHSHIMLLGFVFNALIAMLWIYFTESIDKKSHSIYLGLQVCVGILLIGFIQQGYSFFTIIFSTLHLWLSYILLIRLWKRLKGNSTTIQFVKIGILFHFIASIGPYALAPLKTMGLDETPWYQQAIFFYLHFQYFGSFFMWILAVLFHQSQILLPKKIINTIVLCVVLLFSHSLDYSFDNLIITWTGAIGSILLFGVFFNLKNKFVFLKNSYKYLYFLILLVLFFNCFGSIPYLADLVSTNRFMLIAWLHLLFLGLYLPFIWNELPLKINTNIWVMYGISVLITESILLFPSLLYDLFEINVMMQLFVAYLPVVICICIVHLNFLFDTFKK